MENIVNMCNKYDIKIIYNNKLFGKAMGIGDLLFNVKCMSLNILKKPIYINLIYFIDNKAYPEPLNALEFRIKLLKELLNNNEGVCENDVQYIYSTNKFTCQELNWEKIISFNLNLDFSMCKEIEYKNTEYVIFHTKLRLVGGQNYDSYKKIISKYLAILKSKYTIILLGEKIMPETHEAKVQGITTIYNELLNLKNNNNIIDKTKDNIYNNLNFDDYKNDLLLIKNAKYNISFGLGGQLCSSFMFGKSTLFYYFKNAPYINRIIKNLSLNNNLCFDDQKLFLEFITKTISDC